MTLPTVQEVAEELAETQNFALSGAPDVRSERDEASCDVRLQVMDGNWRVVLEAPECDELGGFYGTGTIGQHDSRFDLQMLAADLLNQVAQMAGANHA